MTAKQLRDLAEGSVADRVNRLVQGMWQECQRAAINEEYEACVFARASTVNCPTLAEQRVALARFTDEARRGKLRIGKTYNDGVQVSWRLEDE